MDTFKFPASPSTPLYPLSPERVNGTRPPYAGPISHHSHTPSLPEFGKSTPLAAAHNRPLHGSIPTVAPFQLDPIAPSSPPKSPLRSAGSHSRTNSDALVQGMIARFDGLSVKDWKAQSETAVKRAEIAREMAELETRKIKELCGEVEGERKKKSEEARKLKRELEESRERERKVARRLEVLMEELHRAKETHGHTISVYEKEVRKARKEAFKSSSAFVKVQEDAKAARAHVKAMQTNLETEKAKAANREQEAFTAQYQLVGAQQEHQKALEQILVLQQERDSLKTSLQEEEVARMAVEGRFALPPPKDDDEDEDLLQSPTRSPVKSPRKMQQRSKTQSSDSEKENVMPVKKSLLQLKALQEELALERRLRQKAVDQIDFMKMECQFECCSCRIAEQRGNHYVHDSTYLTDMERIKKEVPAAEDAMDVDVKDFAENAEQSSPSKDAQETQEVVAFSPDSGTFKALDTPMDDDISEFTKQAPLTNRRATGMRQRHSSFRLSGSVKHSTPDIEDSHTILQEEIAKIHEIVPQPSATPPAEHDESSHSDSDPMESQHSSPEPLSQNNPSTPPASPPLAPQTPAGLAIRTITTTTTIPMQFSPEKAMHKPYQPSHHQDASSMPTTPQTISHPPSFGILNNENLPPTPGAFKADGTIDREAALEMIRQRRNRSRSMVIGQATPHKGMVEGNIRRDISAPVGGKTR
ncbi:hypothetical protein BT63DRAFT_165607 [Microthyrium microscopicum]|uniref:Uncharacterized protein n=1 Tax=Microthyrium microscopicum TaxID=703497 RepID=A0A6A6UQS6_9PEZI|nr:hypothetical protein BT63DRAFT_165607 [Microthyrium microscopicum]